MLNPTRPVLTLSAGAYADAAAYVAAAAASAGITRKMQLAAPVLVRASDLSLRLQHAHMSCSCPASSCAFLNRCSSYGMSRMGAQQRAACLLLPATDES